MSGGRSAKRKGYRVERVIVKAFEKFGVMARRQPLSGALQDFPHDVHVDIPVVGPMTVEVKARGNGKGFVQLDKWRGQANMLVLVQDREAPMVYMPLPLLGEFISALKDK
jgi:Holliday junction resolvase